MGRFTFNLIDNDAVVARYRQTQSRLGLNAGVNLGARSDVRIGAYVGQTSATIRVGDPGFPDLSGSETGAELLWRLDTQDSPVVPSTGLASQLRVSRVLDGPDLAIEGQALAHDASMTQLLAGATRFWSLGPRNRLFVGGSLGTSFDGDPLPTSQFELGTPFKLGAFDAGEIRGNHTYTAAGGYLRQTGRLPDFFGGPVFVGGWLENGDAFDQWPEATWRTHGGVGVMMDTLVGPVLVAGSWSFDGRWRTYLGIGRLFR